MILAAGKGTRLQPLTLQTPKPMLEIAGQPLIGHQVEALRQAGATGIIINLHHLGEQIEDYLGSGERFGVNISYSREAQLLETGGGIVKALPFFEGEPFWLLNGDIYTDFDFRTLPVAPANNNLAHIVLTPTPAYREHGDFEFRAGQVTARGNTHVYCGIGVLTTALFERYAGETSFSFADVMFDLTKENRLGAQVFRGLWQDIGSVDQYHAAREMAERAASGD